MNTKLVMFMGIIAMSTSAQATDSSYSIGISGNVPIVCRASMIAATLSSSPGETDLGVLDEYCNNPNGHQVYVDQAGDLVDASLTVDGNVIALPGHGSTLISSSDQPAIASRSITLSLPHGTTGGTLSIRVVPL